ncbi:unnamed protein product [Ixodes persulcatus]
MHCKTFIGFQSKRALGSAFPPTVVDTKQWSEKNNGLTRYFVRIVASVAET